MRSGVFMIGAILLVSALILIGAGVALMNVPDDSFLKNYEISIEKEIIQQYSRVQICRRKHGRSEDESL